VNKLKRTDKKKGSFLPEKSLPTENASATNETHSKNPLIKNQTDVLLGDLNLSDRKIQALERAGVTLDEIAKCISEGLKSGVWTTEADERGEPINVFKPDMLVRHKYLDTAAKILEILRPDGKLNSIDNSKNTYVTYTWLTAPPVNAPRID
jgi:hypothetical protein